LLLFEIDTLKRKCFLFYFKSHNNNNNNITTKIMKVHPDKNQFYEKIVHDSKFPELSVMEGLELMDSVENKQQQH
jgi:hypothetical protein